MKYYGLIIPRSYNDYFSRSDPQAIKDIVAMSTDAQLNTESAAPIQNKAVAKLIPATASEENQLADKNFVNSTVGTNTANYIYKTDASGDNVPFESIEELEAYSGVVTNNDYAFVTGTDENGNKYFDRYKANVDGDVVTWAKEYRLNNSSFTAEQWAAIESGITAELVSKIGDAGIVPMTTADYEELTEEEKMSGKLHLLTDAQNGFVVITDKVESGNLSAVTSNAVNDLYKIVELDLGEVVFIKNTEFNGYYYAFDYDFSTKIDTNKYELFVPAFLSVLYTNSIAPDAYTLISAYGYKGTAKILSIWGVSARFVIRVIFKRRV